MMCSYTNKADFRTRFQQHHYRIWLASVEPLCEVLAEVSLFYVGTWKVALHFRERPDGLLSRPGRPGLWLDCAAVTDPPAAH